MRPVARLIGKTLFDLHASGLEHIPRTGPVVLAPNHFSHVDPPIVSSLVTRPIRYIAVDELFGRYRLLDGFVSFFGAIPTDRDGYPVGALRTAIAHIDDGGVMGIFPEGARVNQFGERTPKRGAAWLAWIGGAPLIPVAVHGTDGTMTPGDLTLRRTSVRVWIGEPLWWHEYTNRVDPLEAMMDDWAAWIGERLAPWMGDDPLS